MTRPLSYVPKSTIIAGGASAVAGAVAAILLNTLPIDEGRFLPAYLDPVGISTICEGWTRGVKLGDVATNAECDALTLQGIQEAWQLFERWVPADVRDRMPDTSVAAFLSFIYNTGPGARDVKDGFVYLKNGNHSTMLRLLRSGDVAAACRQLPAWASAKGVKLRGLALRRDREMAMCLKDLKP